MRLIYKPQAFIPRGLINISNWCYINAVSFNIFSLTSFTSFVATQFSLWSSNR